MLQDFKKFILRGNVVDLAVAVSVGAAFTAVATAFVKDLITPLITALLGQPNLASMYVTWNSSKFMYGDFLNALLSFTLISVVLFFLVVQPINKFIAFSNRRKKPEDPAQKKCPQCLSDIPKAAVRCAFCTSKVD